MERLEELMKLVNDSNASILVPLIKKMVFLETELDKLEKLPMLKYHPENPDLCKATPAAKLYREFLQQYTNIVKVVSKVTGNEGTEEESPLRKWLKSRNAD